MEKQLDRLLELYDLQNIRALGFQERKELADLAVALMPALIEELRTRPKKRLRDAIERAQRALSDQNFSQLRYILHNALEGEGK